MMSWFRWYVKLVNRLGIRTEPEEWNLFNVGHDLDTGGAKMLAARLRPARYYYNDLSTTYRGQRYTVRKLMDLDHQIHLRFYGNGRVTGHYELATHHPTEHWRGIELRRLTPEESGEIEKLVLGQTFEPGGTEVSTERNLDRA